MKQKHFMDIENLREESTELRESNALGFEVGDIIQITEKVDGANSCACWDSEENCMKAFSRKQELGFKNTLNGFWDYVEAFPEKTIAVFEAHPYWRIFGEWNFKHKIVYFDTGKVKHWYVYDIFDTETERWLHQDDVKQFCKDANLEYVHELYYGEFISWDHVKSFLHSPAYGEKQEGVVVKSMSKLNDEDVRLPFYLKIVNEDFKEKMKTREKVINPESQAAKEEAMKMAESIITKNRIEKELFKMRDEQIVPEKIAPQDMGTVARYLPERIYNDCIKEDKELVLQCGEYFTSACKSLSMKYAREVILGE